MKKLPVFLLVCGFILFLPWRGESRGATAYRINQPAENKVVKIDDGGKKYLFLVAIGRYRQWARLRGPVKETKKLKKILVSKYRFDVVKELYDEKATKEAIKEYLAGLQEGRENELEEKDSLFIYFSGHGQAFEEESSNGYWIPYNGGLDPDARAYWLSNWELCGMLDRINSKQTLVVADSCFAAALIDDDNCRCCNYGNGYCRKVMTSGGMERVPGKSQFARLLINELKKNRKPCITMAEIYDAISREIHEKIHNHPGFGNLKNTRGDHSAPFCLFAK